MSASIIAWFVLVSIFTIIYVTIWTVFSDGLLWEPLLSPPAFWAVAVAYITGLSIYSHKTK